MISFVNLLSAMLKDKKYHLWIPIQSYCFQSIPSYPIGFHYYIIESNNILDKFLLHQ